MQLGEHEMDQQWVAKSLTVWGVVIAVLTAVVPAVGALLPDVAGTLTPEWIAGLDTSVKTAITGVGVLVGSVLVIVDRLRGSGDVKKTLVLRKPE